MRYRDAINRWIDRAGRALAKALFPESNAQVIDVAPRQERRKNRQRPRDPRTKWHVVPDVHHAPQGK
jgi:hypothetical protein